jgi:hypothetical protein
MRGRAAPLAALLLAFSAAAAAQGPEQIDQLEPGAGEWQAEYFGIFGPGGQREHALEAMAGLSERVALGIEAQAEYSDGTLVFDTVGVKGLYRISGEASPVGLGLQVQLDFDDRAALVQTEVRLIAEMESGAWWAQGNVMLRLLRDQGATAIGPAYAMSLQHKLGAHAWLGVEGSGQFEPLSGDTTAAHFLGPSLTCQWRVSPHAQIELGFALFRRIGGQGPHNSGRVFVQTTF